MKFVFIVIITLASISCVAQEHISGRVVSENGRPLAGASVFVPNTTIGITTDINGEFSLTRLPSGNLKIVATFTGYHPTTVVVNESKRAKKYILQLHENASELAVIQLDLHFEKKGLEKWGNIFTTAFIGTSAYAKDVVIQNKETLKFIYRDSLLYAYASEPLIIQNNALGYIITVSLEQFIYNVATADVEYQFYPLFKAMEGNDDEMLKWKKNRAAVYHFSMMNFMRAVYAHNFRNEGFEIHAAELKMNEEKMRVKEIYDSYISEIKDAAGSAEQQNTEVDNSIKKEIGNDSLKYYQDVLTQKDQFLAINDTLLKFSDIVLQTDSNTMLLNFKNYIHVIYTKRKEPVEYLNYKKDKLGAVLTDYDKKNFARAYPITELTLEQGTPIEINENGYFNNTDLYINGFWGWWEKLATKLPYQYEP